MTKKIFVIGSASADHVLMVDSFPRPGETVTGSRYDIIPGGKGANQAVACARLGGTTRFMACLGQDVFGTKVIETFQDDGIETSLIEQIEGMRTGIAMIFVDNNAENCIGIAAEANSQLTAERVARQTQAIAEADYLLMQLETPVEAILKAAQIAQKNHTPVVLNPAPACPLSDELLACIDIITPNQTEAEVLTGIPANTEENAIKAAAALHNKGIATVVITMGKKGALISEKSESRIATQLINGFSVKATDTTAAGDTFNGGMLVALAEGKSLTDAIRFGNACGALSVTRSGAQTSIPSRAEADQFLEAWT
ncbi:ribokinase [Sansalvadorimonas verongulae]|uniref:ribokinase n=1 Tax=Sansalvadorimonas verongulae TaxID=2172824 RepID=UPI0012BC4F3D|nr:ribokinase [Sansalvadorimonas verongulae]MTI14599.1 ribokinase [Sansalvadorimonas verongulae]